LNLCTFGLIASTLTITPLRWLGLHYSVTLSSADIMNTVWNSRTLEKSTSLEPHADSS
jgi:hypothetical protein